MEGFIPKLWEMGSCKFSRISIDWGLDILLPQNFIGGVNYNPIGLTMDLTMELYSLHKKVKISTLFRRYQSLRKCNCILGKLLWSYWDRTLNSHNFLTVIRIGFYLQVLQLGIFCSRKRRNTLENTFTLTYKYTYYFWREK